MTKNNVLRLAGLKLSTFFEDCFPFPIKSDTPRKLVSPISCYVKEHHFHWHLRNS